MDGNNQYRALSDDVYETKPEKSEPEPGLREFLINVNQEFRDPGDRRFRSNTIKTAKYTILTFLPLNLLFQFTKMANFYFLLLVLLELYPPVHTPGGALSMLFPLLFVVGVSMVKDIFEDRKRHISDDEENMRPVNYIP